MFETQKNKDKAEIISGDSFSELVRKADNNQHRTSGGSYQSGEYLYVNIILEGYHDVSIVPTGLDEVTEDSCKFKGWMPVDGHRIYISGQYDKNFENSFIRYVGDVK